MHGLAWDVKQWGTGNIKKETLFPITFTTYRKISVLHFGKVTTVNLIELDTYRNNLQKTYIDSNFEQQAEFDFITLGK